MCDTGAVLSWKQIEGDISKRVGNFHVTRTILESPATRMLEVGATCVSVMISSSDTCEQALQGYLHGNLYGYFDRSNDSTLSLSSPQTIHLSPPRLESHLTERLSPRVFHAVN